MPAIEHNLPVEEETTEAPTLGPSDRPIYAQKYLEALRVLPVAQEAYIRHEITREEFTAALETANAAYLEWIEDCRKKGKEK